MELAKLLESLNPDELRYIAERNHSQDAERHLEALREVVTNGGNCLQGNTGSHMR